jgi:hypothetical protein
MSGVTPECWKANRRPVRPRPHCTSSKTRSAPRSRQREARPFRNSAEAGRTPPSPWTGSIITAAVLSLTAVAAAPRSFQGQKWTPGTRGSKGSRYFGLHVVDRAPRVRPWKERSKHTNSVRPAARPTFLANFMAPSHASVPELQKKTLDGNARARRRSASAEAGSLWKRLLAWMSCPACLRIAATTFASP